MKNIMIILMIFTLALTGGCKRDNSQAGSTISVYTRSDSCGAAETWAKYLGHKQEDLKGTGISSDPGIAEAVRNDINGIGYNNINYAYDSATRKPLMGLVIAPIDLNNDGKITPDEDFYNSRDELQEAIIEGKYPSPPARDLYFVTKGNPQRKAVRDFIHWVLTEGQQYVDEAGYVKFSDEKLKEQLGKLGTAEGTAGAGKETITMSGAWALYPLAVKWGEEYAKINRNIAFETSGGGAGKGMTDALSGMVDIGLVSRELQQAEIDKGAFGIAVTKDAVVPVVNADNPMIKEIKAKGVKKEAFEKIWMTGDGLSWKDIIAGDGE